MSGKVKRKIEKISEECLDIFNELDKNEIEIRKLKIHQRKLTLILKEKEKKIEALQKQQHHQSNVINVSEESD